MRELVPLTNEVAALMIVSALSGFGGDDAILADPPASVPSEMDAAAVAAAALSKDAGDWGIPSPRHELTPRVEREFLVLTGSSMRKETLMTLEQALSELGEVDASALPAINRRHGARRETLLLSGNDETAARLDDAFDVVSTYYWSVVEPTIRSGYEDRREQRAAETRNLQVQRVS